MQPNVLRQFNARDGASSFPGRSKPRCIFISQQTCGCSGAAISLTYRHLHRAHIRLRAKGIVAGAPPYEDAKQTVDDAPKSTRTATANRAATQRRHAQEGVKDAGSVSRSPSDNGAASSNVSASPSGAESASVASPKQEAQVSLEQYQIIYDRLIKIFQERPRDDWKKLIVFSSQWNQHCKGVFDRIKEHSEKEADIDKKLGLRRMLRSLQSVDEEVRRYDGVVQRFLTAAEDEWEPIVAIHRGDLQKGFFEHMQCLIAAARNDANKRDDLILMNTKLIALVSGHDSVVKDKDKLDKAGEVYRDLLGSISSLEDADRKMADLGKAGKIDPAFLHISAKAYGAARDTNMTLDEAKWVSYKLYRNARDQFDRQQPKEKRILEYLVTISDPQERRRQLDKAVTPGPTRNSDTHDFMWSTPARLFAVLDGTLQAFNAMKAGAQENLNSSPSSMMPRKVRILRDLRDDIMRRYL